MTGQELELARRDAKKKFYNDIRPEAVDDGKPLNDFDAGWKAAVTTCEAESKLAAAAMAEKCADVAYAHKATMLGPSTNKLLNDFGLEISIKIRSISPAGVLEAHDQAVSIEEHKLICKTCQRVILEGSIVNPCQRLAALRTTPQPTAVKENANE